MASKIKWNRLLVEAKSNEEFEQAILELFPKLLELDDDEVECDFTRVTKVSKSGFSALATALSDLGSSSKHLTIRAPSGFENFFAKTGLLNVSNLSIELIRSIGKKEKPPQPAASSTVNDEPEVGEITDASGKLAASLDDVKPPPPRARKPISSLGGGKVPLPGGGSGNDDDMNRRTLVGMPVDVFAEEAAPPTRRDDDGIEELMIGQDSISNAGDLVDIDNTADYRGREASDAPEMDTAFLRDEETGEVKELSDEFIIGRTAPADWVINAATISKSHVRIYHEDNRFYLEDMNATNGTFINKVQVKGTSALLLAGDIITVAHTLKTPEGVRKFTFHAEMP